MKKKVFFILIICLLLSACSTSNGRLYSWSQILSTPSMMADLPSNLNGTYDPQTTNGDYYRCYVTVSKNENGSFVIENVRWDKWLSSKKKWLSQYQTETDTGTDELSSYQKEYFAMLSYAESCVGLSANPEALPSNQESWIPTAYQLEIYSNYKNVNDNITSGGMAGITGELYGTETETKINEEFSDVWLNISSMRSALWKALDNAVSEAVFYSDPVDLPEE